MKPARRMFWWCQFSTETRLGSLRQIRLVMSNLVIACCYSLRGNCQQQVVNSPSDEPKCNNPGQQTCFNNVLQPDVLVPSDINLSRLVYAYRHSRIPKSFENPSRRSRDSGSTCPRLLRTYCNFRRCKLHVTRIMCLSLHKIAHIAQAPALAAMWRGRSIQNTEGGRFCQCLLVRACFLEAFSFALDKNVAVSILRMQ